MSILEGEVESDVFEADQKKKKSWLVKKCLESRSARRQTKVVIPALTPLSSS